MYEWIGVRAVYYTRAAFRQLSRRAYKAATLDRQERLQNSQLLNPTSAGTSAPHVRTSHPGTATCTIQVTTIAASAMRVNRGSRKRYERARLVLRLGIETVGMVVGVVDGRCVHLV